MSHPAHMPRIGLLAQAPLCRMVGQMEENPHQTRETDDASALFMLTPEGLGGVRISLCAARAYGPSTLCAGWPL